MKYLLDTNTCIRFLNGRVPQVRKHFYKHDAADIALCSVVKAEMLAGAMKSQTPQATLANQREFFKRFESLPFDDAVAEEYARLRAYLETHGTPIGGNDMLIAAI